MFPRIEQIPLCEEILPNLEIRRPVHKNRRTGAMASSSVSGWRLRSCEYLLSVDFSVVVLEGSQWNLILCRNAKKQKADVDVQSPTRRALVSAGSEDLAGMYKDRPVFNFTFHQLAAATQNFNDTNFLGEGGFGKVFRGQLESGELVAVKQLNADGCQGFKEFITEVLMLSLLHHPNLVTLTGYCTDGDQRLLVYEFMTQGSLEDHLLYKGPDKEPLSCENRIKIAVGAARGLEYLHSEANPPVIYRDLKSANILLDSDFNAKLSDFGLAKLGPVGENTHVSTRVMGTYGYCAPEYAMSGHLTLKSDIFSFGVVLLELITGWKAYDNSRNHAEQNIVPWALPHLKLPKKFVKFVDPRLQGKFSVRCMHHMIAIAALCIQEDPQYRPKIHDIVLALEFIAAQPFDPLSHRRADSPAARVEPLPDQAQPRPQRSTKHMVLHVTLRTLLPGVLSFSKFGKFYQQFCSLFVQAAFLRKSYS